MAEYVATIIDGESGGEGRYDFEGPDDLLNQTPVRVVRTFMEHVDKDLFPRQLVDYELNAAFKSPHKQLGSVITAMGIMIFEADPEHDRCSPS